MKIITTREIVFGTENSDELHELEGSIFRGHDIGANESYMFAQVAPAEYNFIGIMSGNRLGAPFKSIDSFKKIGAKLLYTKEEFQNILRIGGFNGK